MISTISSVMVLSLGESRSAARRIMTEVKVVRVLKKKQGVRIGQDGMTGRGKGNSRSRVLIDICYLNLDMEASQ
jgi:hypothetical protein